MCALKRVSIGAGLASLLWWWLLLGSPSATWTYGPDREWSFLPARLHLQMLCTEHSGNSPLCQGLVCYWGIPLDIGGLATPLWAPPAHRLHPDGWFPCPGFPPLRALRGIGCPDAAFVRLVPSLSSSGSELRPWALGRLLRLELRVG